MTNIAVYFLKRGRSRLFCLYDSAIVAQRTAQSLHEDFDVPAWICEYGPGGFRGILVGDRVV